MGGGFSSSRGGSGVPLLLVLGRLGRGVGPETVGPVPKGGSSGAEVSLGPVSGGSSRAEMAEEMLSCRSLFFATESSSSEEKEGSVSRLRFSSSSSRLQGDGQPSPRPSLSAASNAPPRPKGPEDAECGTVGAVGGGGCRPRVGTEAGTFLGGLSGGVRPA